MFSCEPFPSWPPSLLPTAIHLALPSSLLVPAEGWKPRARSWRFTKNASCRGEGSRECLGAGALGNKDTKGSVCVRRLLGSLGPAPRPLFMLRPLPRALFCLLRFSKSHPPVSQEAQWSPQRGVPEVSPCFLTSLTPHLSLERMVHVTHLAHTHIGRLPGGGDSQCRELRTTKDIWGWGGLWALTPTLLNAKLSLPPLSPTPDSRPP